jgi:hypothetical protein
LNAFSRLAKGILQAFAGLGLIVIILLTLMVILATAIIVVAALLWIAYGLCSWNVIVGVWVGMVMIGPVGLTRAGLSDEPEQKYKPARSRGVARPVDDDVHEFTTLSAADWARLYRRHRRRSVVLGILTLLVTPPFAIAVGAAWLNAENFSDSREHGVWPLEYFAFGISVITALVALFWGWFRAVERIMSGLYVVVGQALDRTFVSADGILAGLAEPTNTITGDLPTPEPSDPALRVNIDRCLEIDKRGHLNRSDQRSGIETFTGPDKLLGVPDDRTGILVCKTNGRITKRLSNITR